MREITRVLMGLITGHTHVARTANGVRFITLRDLNRAITFFDQMLF
jgi:hypothetical protein